MLLVVHFDDLINARGSQVGFVVGLLVRISGGESKLKIPPVIKYPGFDCQANKQNFPFRTLAMIMSLCACLLGSALFTDPHPMSPEGEETPFYKKGKTPRDQSPAVAEEEVTSTIDKMRLEGIIHFDIGGNDPFFMETSISFSN